MGSSRRSRAPSSDATVSTALGRRHRPDYPMLILTLLLIAIGLVTIYSISPALSARLPGDISPNHFMYRQIQFLVLGFIVFGVASALPLAIWVKMRKYIIAFAVLSFVFLFIPALSIEYLGATRWVHIGPINYQPAEILKFGLVFAVAGYLAHQIKQQKIDDPAVVKWFLSVVAIVGLEIVIIQRDLGTMIPIIAIMLAMLYVSGIATRQFILVTGIIVFAAALSILPFQHRRERVFTFLNTSANTEDESWHINQSLIAVGSGGFFGKGLGRSVQAYGYVPEAGNDSIFAIMAEKFGFFGMAAIFSIYGALLLRILSIAKRAPNHYLQLVVSGVFAWIAIQAFVNIGAMLSIMPLTGVTLPLLSFGGTSLVFTMAALGVVFHISRYTKLEATDKGVYHEDSYGRGRLGRPRYTA